MNFNFQSLKEKVSGLISPTIMPLAPSGTSGTDIVSGMFTEEYLTALLAEDGINAFDKMRRSDGQVKMLLSVVKNPIKSARWCIIPADDSDEEREIAAFIEHILFNDIGYADGSKNKTFSEFIAEALTLAEFGFSIFEIVHKVVENHPRFGTYIGLSDLGFRHQRTILEWHLERNGAIKDVRQFVGSGDLNVDVLINGEHLLVFSNEKEGDNYEGISMLRPCYGNWFRKNIYRKLQAIGIERAAKGVPIGKIPADLLQSSDYEEQRTEFQKVIDALSSHQTNGIVMGAGFELDELKLSHDADKVQKVIKSENVEMTKSFLANFMELGLESNSGSFALGSDLSNIFLSGLTCVSRIIEERIDSQLIKTLVRAKYGERDSYPTIKANGINDKAGKELAEVIKMLIEVGAMQNSEMLTEHLAAIYKLPIPDNIEIAEPEDKAKDDKEPELELEPDEKEEGEKLSEHKEDCLCADEFQKIYDDLKKNTLKLCDFEDETLLSQFEINMLNEKLYAAAAKDARFADVIPSVFITRQAEILEDSIRKMLTDRSDKMISTIVNIFKNEGDKNKARTGGLEQKLPNKKAFKDMIRASVGDTGNKALDAVLKELNATRETFKLSGSIGDLPSGSRGALVAEAALAAEFLDADLEKVILFSYNLNFDQTDSAAVINAELIRGRDKFLSGGRLKTIATNITSKTTNSIRNDVFQDDDVLEVIESFVFTNPAPVTAICTMLTGRVFSKEEYATTPNLPPLHHNCMDSSTEVYTDNGWKLFEDIDIEEDTFLSLNPENFDMEYVEAHRYIARPHKGEMYHFTNNQGSVSQCVTPDHPMVYMKRVDHGKAGKTKEWTESDIPTFIAHGSEASIYCTSEWKGISKDFIEVNGKKYPTEEFLKMMGYYLSEGHCDKNFISISQFHKENLAIIKKDMESFNFNVRKSGIAFKDPALYEWLAQFGKSHQKFVPEIIKDLSPEHLRVFLDAYCLGDGCTYKDRPCFTGKTTYRMFATSSKRMAGDITELLIKIGRSASMRIVTPKGTETKHHNGIYTSNHDVWGVFELSSKTRRVTKIDKIDYDGFVYDVSLVKNHTLLIKHNGCISWGSNCKSTIAPQRTEQRTKKPISDDGLGLVGTTEDINKAKKSITI